MQTGTEVQAIKETLAQVFAGGSTDASSNLYKVFTGLLSSQDEFPLDLLPWAFDNYTMAILPAAAKKTLPITAPPPSLQGFLQSFGNHFRAASPIIRYAAAICLHAAANICPKALLDDQQILLNIISECLDSDYLTSYLYLTILDSLKLVSEKSLQQSLDRMKRVNFGDMNYDKKYIQLPQGSAAAISNLFEALESACKRVGTVPPKFLQKTANGLEYLPKEQKIRQLDVINLWVSKLDKINTFLIQSLVPYLTDEDTDIQYATTKIFKNLSNSLKTALSQDVSYLWTHYKSVLNSSALTNVCDIAIGTETSLRT